MSDNIDPEVLADLQLRAASARDSSRTRGAGVYDWQRPEFVDAWPCRYPGCTELIGVDQDTCEQRVKFNRILKARAEAPIDVAVLLMCSKHTALFIAERGKRLRAKCERVAENIRKLKDHAQPRTAKDLIAALEKDHHPDIPGLLDAIETRRAGSSETKRRAKGASL